MALLGQTGVFPRLVWMKKMYVLYTLFYQVLTRPGQLASLLLSLLLFCAGTLFLAVCWIWYASRQHRRRFQKYERQRGESRSPLMTTRPATRRVPIHHAGGTVDVFLIDAPAGDERQENDA